MSLICLFKILSGLLIVLNFIRTDKKLFNAKSLKYTLNNLLKYFNPFAYFFSLPGLSWLKAVGNHKNII